MKPTASHRSADRPLIFLSYLAIYLIWGSTYLAIRIGVRDLPPFLFAGARHLTAGVLMALFALAKGEPFPRSPRDYGRLALGGLLLLCCANGLVSWAEQWVTSSLTSAVLAAIPLFTALLEALWSRVRLGRDGLAGLFVGFAGVLILLGPEAPAGGRGFAGALVVLLAAFFWALGTVYVRRRTVEAPLFPRVAGQMIAAGLGLLAVGLPAGRGTSLHLTVEASAAFAYLVVFGSFLAYTAFGYLLEREPAAKVATHAYVNPVVGVILGGLLLGEKVTGWMLIALPMVLAGVVMVQRAGVEKAKDGVFSQEEKSAGA
mgnify:FL=1